MTSGFLDTVLGAEEGGSAGVGLLAGLKTAGIATGPYAPWIIGGAAGLNILGKFLGRRADAPAERMNMRLGEQNLEMNSMAIQEQKRQAARTREAERKKKAMQAALSGVFGEYSALKKGGGSNAFVDKQPPTRG